VAPRVRGDKDAILAAAKVLASAKRPLIMAGVEIHRFALQDELTLLAEKTRIPIATTIMGKSVIGEKHPLFIGLYEGRMCRDELRQYVEDARVRHARRRRPVTGAVVTDVLGAASVAGFVRHE